jgi:xylan 1,4-beta-xylosidase
MKRPIPETVYLFACLGLTACPQSQATHAGMDGSVVDSSGGGTAGEGGSTGGDGGSPTQPQEDAGEAALDAATEAEASGPPPVTFANPIDIEYRFELSGTGESHREAADPAMILFQNTYYLFASKSGCYWYSTDLANWTQVKPNWPTSVFEEYAPATWSIGSTLYFATPSSIYSTTTPQSGDWTFVANNFQNLGDPAFMVDDDGKVYAYWGLSNSSPLQVVEVDPVKFQNMGSPINLFSADPTNHGFEVSGDMNNDYSLAPWQEGSWMTKHNGVYYLQYAVPGTQFVSYSDGVWTSNSPTGPFTFAQNSPFSSRASGFSNAAGHSSTFQDRYGNWWHVSTSLVGVKADFERRVSLYPAGFDSMGAMFVNTDLGDFPIQVPQGVSDPLASRPVWMLLSYGKSGTASSTFVSADAGLDCCCCDHPEEQTLSVANAFDEDIRSVWSAATGNTGEWLQVDLGQMDTIWAVQSNFAEQDATYYSQSGVTTDAFSWRYVVDASTDGTNWNHIIDRSSSTRDTPHDYVPLTSPVVARYLRITNEGQVPGGGEFSVRDFRIFGTSGESPPSMAPKGVTATRGSDTRSVTITWDTTSDATGYVVRYGISPTQLYTSYQVWGQNIGSATLNTLNVGVDYYFTVDSFNEGGETQGTSTVEASH